MQSKRDWYIWSACKDSNGIVGVYKIVGWGSEIADYVAFCRRLNKGTALTKQEYPAPTTAVWEEWTPLTDCPNTNLPVLLSSSKLKKVLDQLGIGTDIQWLPIKVVGSETYSQVGTYYILNCLKIIPCAIESDRRKTTCPSSAHEQVIKMHLSKTLSKRADLRDCFLFRVREHDDHIIVHSRVKDAVEQSEATGCCFDGL
jgi:hypothetical protein